MAASGMLANHPVELLTVYPGLLVGLITRLDCASSHAGVSPLIGSMHGEGCFRSDAV